MKFQNLSFFTYLLLAVPVFAANPERVTKAYFPNLIRLDRPPQKSSSEGQSVSSAETHSKYIRIRPIQSNSFPISSGESQAKAPRFADEDPLDPDSSTGLIEETLFDISVGIFKQGQFVVAQKYQGRLEYRSEEKVSDEIAVYPLGKKDPIIKIGDNGRFIQYENTQRIQPGTRVRSFPINTLVGADKSSTEECFVCKWVNSSPPSPSEDACVDLATAACSDENGDSKFKERLEKLQNQLTTLVEDARTKAAKMMGYKSPEEAILKAVSKTGFATVKTLNKQARDFLTSGRVQKALAMEEVFLDSKNCRSGLQDLQNQAISQTMDSQKWNEWTAQANNFGSLQLSRIAIASSFDLPSFVAGFAEKCERWRELKSNFTKPQLQSLPEEYSILQKVCQNQAPLRKQAIQIYRAGDAESARQAKKDFFQKYFRARLVNLESLTESLELQEQKKSLSESKYKQSLFKIKISELTELCQILDETLTATPRAARTQTNFILSLAKPTVETLLKSIYTEERKTQIQKLFNQARSEAMGVARRFTSDSEMLAKIKSNFEKLTLTWLDLPSEDSYTTLPGLPFEILQLDKYTSAPGNPYAAAFTDPSLSYFTDINAYYTPSLEVGTIRHGLSVTILPLLLRLYDTNPFGFLTILAHEIGHNIGPRMSAINGYDLRAETNSALACFASSDSINMATSQSDETMADLVAAQVMASLFSQLPSSQRKNAVVSAAEPFCYFQAQSEKEFDIRTGDNHPESILRVSGILGANPDLRNVMGCKNKSEPRDFQSCGL